MFMANAAQYAHAPTLDHMMLLYAIECEQYIEDGLSLAFERIGVPCNVIDLGTLLLAESAIFFDEALELPSLNDFGAEYDEFLQVEQQHLEAESCTGLQIKVLKLIALTKSTTALTDLLSIRSDVYMCQVTALIRHAQVAVSLVTLRPPLDIVLEHDTIDFLEYNQLYFSSMGDINVARSIDSDTIFGEQLLRVNLDDAKCDSALWHNSRMLKKLFQQIEIGDSYGNWSRCGNIQPDTRIVPNSDVPIVTLNEFLDYGNIDCAYDELLCKLRTVYLTLQIARAFSIEPSKMSCFNLVDTRIDNSEVSQLKQAMDKFVHDATFIKMMRVLRHCSDVTVTFIDEMELEWLTLDDEFIAYDEVNLSRLSDYDDVFVQIVLTQQNPSRIAQSELVGLETFMLNCDFGEVFANEILLDTHRFVLNIADVSLQTQTDFVLKPRAYVDGILSHDEWLCADCTCYDLTLAVPFLLDGFLLCVVIFTVMSELAQYNILRLTVADFDDWV